MTKTTYSQVKVHISTHHPQMEKNARGFGLQRESAPGCKDTASLSCRLAKEGKSDK